MNARFPPLSKTDKFLVKDIMIRSKSLTYHTVYRGVRNILFVAALLVLLKKGYLRPVLGSVIGWLNVVFAYLQEF